MESKPTLINALVKAQSEMSHAAFDQTNPHFKSKFASLKSVIDAVNPRSMPTESPLCRSPCQWKLASLSRLSSMDTVKN